MGDDMSKRIVHANWLKLGGGSLPVMKIIVIMILAFVPVLILGSTLVAAEVTYQTPTLTIDKETVDATFIIGGTPPVYTISVTNGGADPVAGVISIQDTLPTGLTFVSASSADPGWVCPSPTTQTVTCTKSDGLAVSATTTVNLVVSVGQAAAPSVTNTAAVLVDSTSIATDSETTPVESADLRVTKTVSDSTPDVNQEVDFTISVGNHGPSPATSVVLTDTLPSQLQFVTSTPSQGSYNSTTGVWTVGDLAYTTTPPTPFTATLTLRARMLSGASGTTVTNTATAASRDLYDYNTANNTASVILTAPSADLRVTKTDNQTTVEPGETYTYTISVYNYGSQPANNIIITDTLPNTLNYITDTMGVEVQESGNIFVWETTEDLAAAGTTVPVKDFYLQVRVDNTLPSSTTSIVNSVQVGTESPEAVKTNNSASDTNTASGTHNVSITLSVSPSSARTGENVTYTIRVTNSGNSSVTNVSVSDTFSQYLDLVSASTTKGSRDLNTSTRRVTASIGTLNADQSATVTVVARVNSVARANTTVSNSASVSYQFGGTTFTKTSSSASFSLVYSSTLPGTGGIELVRVVETPWSRVVVVTILSAAILGILGLAIFVFGIRARARQSDWAGWAVRMGFIFILAAGVFGLAAWGIAEMIGIEPVPTLIAQLKSAEKAQATPAGVEDPPWVGFAPQGDLEVLPDFPIPEPAGVAPDENGDLPDTSPINRIILPSIGVDTVVKYVPYDGLTWLIAGLQQEIAWMGDTSWPGLGSNTGLAGHVSLRNGRDGPFRYLDQLATNDEITLYTEENIYTYKVREKKVVTDTDFSVIEPSSTSQITLITCTNWDAGTGYYRDRLIVFADFVSSKPLEQVSLNP